MSFLKTEDPGLNLLRCSSVIEYCSGREKSDGGQQKRSSLNA
jgi:hypothetical protein